MAIGCFGMAILDSSEGPVFNVSSHEKGRSSLSGPNVSSIQNCNYYGRLRITGRSPVQQHMQQHMAMAMEARTGLVLKLCTRGYILRTEQGRVK